MDDVVAELAKNPLEKICIAVREFKGHASVDIRVSYQDDAGAWHPMWKGIAVQASPKNRRNFVRSTRSPW
jgi:hypothetical protein